jgi:hypothetical protein
LPSLYPHHPPLRAGAGDLAGTQRATLRDLIERRLHEAGAPLIETRNPGVCVLAILGGRHHPPAQQRMHFERHQRRHVPPIFEQLSIRRRANPRRVEHFRRIGTETRKERHVVRSNQHVDRIDLQQTDSRDDASQVPAIQARPWPRLREPLRRQRNSSRFVRRHRSSHVCSQSVPKRLLLISNGIRFFRQTSER